MASGYLKTSKTFLLTTLFQTRLFHHIWEPRQFSYGTKSKHFGDIRHHLLFNALSVFTANSVNFVSLTEKIEAGTPVGMTVFSILAAVSGRPYKM